MPDQRMTEAGICFNIVRGLNHVSLGTRPVSTRIEATSEVDSWVTWRDGDRDIRPMICITLY